MRIFTIIVCLFLSVSALGQSRDTVYVDAHKKLGLKNGDKQAYIEVDGNPYNGRLESIDTSKISKISVLNPENATKLYGSKGANGAILIDTKNIEPTPQNVQFRCMATLPYSPDPLYIVNDEIYKDNINTIDPENIASIDVLKGVKATALYGAAGANGVVLVTTKNTINKLDSTKTATNIVIHDGPPSHKTKVLFVIDGKQTYTNAFESKNMPDPNSIESVDILKPATAIIKYGKLGENGAIIVTTKNGAVPIYQKKLSTLSQEYKAYLLAHKNNDAAIYYVINGEVINDNPLALDKKLDGLSTDQIMSADFFEKWSKTLNNQQFLLVIKTK